MRLADDCANPSINYLYQSSEPCPTQCAAMQGPRNDPATLCYACFFACLIAENERSHVAELTGDVLASCIMSSKLGYCWSSADMICVCLVFNIYVNIDLNILISLFSSWRSIFSSVPYMSRRLCKPSKSRTKAADNALDMLIDSSEMKRRFNSPISASVRNKYLRQLSLLYSTDCMLTSVFDETESLFARKWT